MSLAGLRCRWQVYGVADKLAVLLTGLRPHWQVYGLADRLAVSLITGLRSRWHAGLANRLRVSLVGLRCPSETACAHSNETTDLLLLRSSLINIFILKFSDLGAYIGDSYDLNMTGDAVRKGGVMS